MTNKDFMIFQTAVKKYVDMHEKSSYFCFVFIHRFKKIIRKNFGRKMRKIFLML
jgi:hypothetical protein